MNITYLCLLLDLVTLYCQSSFGLVCQPHTGCLVATCHILHLRIKTSVCGDVWWRTYGWKRYTSVKRYAFSWLCVWLSQCCLAWLCVSASMWEVISLSRLATVALAACGWRQTAKLMLNSYSLWPTLSLAFIQYQIFNGRINNMLIVLLDTGPRLYECIDKPAFITI